MVIKRLYKEAEANPETITKEQYINGTYARGEYDSIASAMQALLLSNSKYPIQTAFAYYWKEE